MKPRLKQALQPLQRLLPALLIAASLLVALNAWFAFHAETLLARSEHWVTHTLDVITNLERALHLASSAEASIRRYVMFGDSRDIIDFNQSALELPKTFVHLEVLTADNPPQQRRLLAAAAMAQEHLLLLRQGVVDEHNQEVDHPGMLLPSEASRDGLLQLRSSVEAAEQLERRLLVMRLAETSLTRAEARVAIALASALDILFVIFCLWSLSYERALRQRADESAARLDRLQSLTEVASTQLTAAELTSELLVRLRVAAETDVLMLCRWQDPEIELVAAEGIPIRPGERRTILATGAIAEAARTGEIVRLDGQSIARLPVEALQAGLGSALIIPMSVALILGEPSTRHSSQAGHSEQTGRSEQVIAFLLAGRHRGSGFSPADERLLSLAADRIAVALDRAAAYDAERAARRAAEQNAAEIQSLNAVLEQRVQQRTAELESTNRELEAFSYSVSHDLRAPLRTVDGFSVALAEDYGDLLEGDGKHYLARIRVGVQRMGQLIDALLQLSRITRAEFSTERTNLSALAESVAEEVRRSPVGHSLAFTIEPALTAQADPRLMRLVFENMFGNAAKFTGKRADPAVQFGWSADRQAFYVRDNGAGFDQQYAGKLFVAFQRLHGDKDFQGSGIGLATVARVIARHHGHIWAEAVEGQGATFWFTLG